MDTKEQPPAYTDIPREGETQQQAPPQYQATPQYQYQAQPQYGYQQPPANFGTVAAPGYIVSGVAAVPPMGGTVYNTPPQDYTTQAWLACLCCFWPTGLLAILRANESRDALARGDMAGAHSAANGARLMVRISLGVGIASMVVAVAIVVIWIALVATSFNNYDD